MTHETPPLLVTGSFSPSEPRISRYTWVIGFLTRQQARFDAPNTATVASTNKLLPGLCDRTANWHQRWPIFCVFSLVLAVVTAAVHGRRRTGAGSVLTADSKKKDDFFLKSELERFSTDES